MDIGIERGSQTNGTFFSSSLKILTVILLVFIILIILIIRVQTKYRNEIVDSSEVSSPNVALVFGAGLKAKGQPGAVLEDRIKTAIKLFQEGKVGKFIMSGYVSDDGHDEVTAMKNFALQSGMPEDSILIDDQGLNTLQSCQNIKNKFNLTRIVLITQKYHLSRALYLCNESGISSVGVASENRGYSKQIIYTLREYMASIDAWLKINIVK